MWWFFSFFLNRFFYLNKFPVWKVFFSFPFLKIFFVFLLLVRKSFFCKTKCYFKKSALVKKKKFFFCEIIFLMKTFVGVQIFLVNKVSWWKKEILVKKFKSTKKLWKKNCGKKLFCETGFLIKKNCQHFFLLTVTIVNTVTTVPTVTTVTTITQVGRKVCFCYIYSMYTAYKGSIVIMLSKYSYHINFNGSHLLTPGFAKVSWNVLVWDKPASRARMGQ